MYGVQSEKNNGMVGTHFDEASYYKTNTFLTLTYNDENLPKDGSLSKEEVQKYLKGYVKGWMVVRLSSTRPVNMEKKTEGRIII